MVASALVMTLAALVAQTPPITGERSVVSKCPVETDAEWGYTKEKPIKVGGSPLYGPARQRQFLQTLVGPGGQALSFKRRGSTDSGLPDVILDIYEVTYEGLAAPIVLYMDLYRWEIPRAPAGFLCGAAFSMAPPPPNPFALHRKLIAAAIERSTVDSLPPIPLDAQLPGRGMVFDGLRVVTLAAREIVRKGGMPTERDLMKVPDHMVVVANPVACGADRVEAEGVGLVAGQRQIQSGGPLVEGDALRKLLPGIDIPNGAVGAVYNVPAPPSNSQIAIKYKGTACGSEPLLFPMKFAPPKRISTVDGIMPEGVDASAYIGNVSVGVRFTVGPDGRPSDLSVVSGEARFAEAAMEAVRQWQYELPTVNGWPVFAPVTTTASVRMVKR